MDSSRQYRAGYSLLELVLAVAIFSVGVVAVLELFAACLRSSSVSLGYTQAVFLAQELLEEEIADGGFTDTTDSGGFGDNYPSHSWSYDAEETDQEGLYQLRVVVSWTERGKTKEYELTTLAADRM
ncbi:MAG: prepilin-type N-terminal cleavage/methylation domain-containing protein [Candidatus Hydrogenedentes bacterium]|nr:prepilin-type N-terminal cleavage/methylation domain-containing protein [Candidatus Hydrogenedentota bacterium]